MENLVFSLNATLPVFILMILGYVFKKAGIIDDVFSSKMNSFVFKVTLPLLVFKDLAVLEIQEAWNTRFIFFCFFATVISIFTAFVVSMLLKDKHLRGEFVQAAYRSSAAILGISFINNIYGTSGMAPLMILGSVPLYNIMAVVVLELLKPDTNGLDKKVINKTFKGIITNPMLIGIVIGILFSALKVPYGGIPQKVVNNLAATASPMGLMAMGASFEPDKALKVKVNAFIAVFLKMIGFVCIFLPVAIYMGFRESELIAILVMLGSATTVSAYVMARNMGHEGVLTSSVVMLTTLLSSFTLTGWLFLLKTYGYV